MSKFAQTLNTGSAHAIGMRIEARLEAQAYLRLEVLQAKKSAISLLRAVLPVLVHLRNAGHLELSYETFEQVLSPRGLMQLIEHQGVACASGHAASDALRQYMAGCPLRAQDSGLHEVAELLLECIREEYVQGGGLSVDENLTALYAGLRRISHHTREGVRLLLVNPEQIDVIVQFVSEAQALAERMQNVPGYLLRGQACNAAALLEAQKGVNPDGIEDPRRRKPEEYEWQTSLERVALVAFCIERGASVFSAEAANEAIGLGLVSKGQGGQLSLTQDGMSLVSSVDPIATLRSLLKRKLIGVVAAGQAQGG